MTSNWLKTSASKHGMALAALHLGRIPRGAGPRSFCDALMLTGVGASIMTVVVGVSGTSSADADRRAAIEFSATRLRIGGCGSSVRH